MYEVLVCADDEKGLFLKLVSALQKSSLSVLDARIHTTRDGKALDTFLAMDAGKRPEPQEVFEIASSNILDSLSGRRRCRRVRLGPLSRRSKHFPIRPQVLIEPDASGTTYLLTLSCNDRLGLLYSHLKRSLPFRREPSDRQDFDAGRAGGGYLPDFGRHSCGLECVP